MIEIRHEKGQALQKSYNKLFQSKSIAQPEINYRWMAEQLKITPGSRLLDVACGEGLFLPWVIQRQAQAFGVDFSTTAINVAKSQVPQGGFMVANGDHLPYANNSFDYVTNIGSLEHFENMELGTREMARVLKPTGKALILLPNLFGMLWNVPYVKQTGDICDDGQPLQRYATPKEWWRLLERNSFIVEKMLPFGWAWPKGIKEWCRYLKNPRLLMVLFIWQPRHFPNLANVLVYVCSKQVGVVIA